jgi:hypothetical protein
MIDLNVELIFEETTEKWAEHEAAGNTGEIQVLGPLSERDSIDAVDSLNREESPFIFRKAQTYGGWLVMAHA